MHRLITPLLALAFALGAQAQSPETPLRELPYTPSLDVAAMDRRADPCEDLYQFSCGGWMQANPIPDDQSRWSVYAKLANDNQRYLWGVLEELAGAPSGTPAQQQLGHYFAACMDENALETAGMQPLQPLLERIEQLSSKRALPALLAALQRAGGGTRFLFGYGAGQDLDEPTRVIGFIAAGGLSLPDRADYLDQDPKSRALRAQYLAHITQVFTLLGDANPLLSARSVLASETQLARARLTRVEQRDPYALRHPMSLRQVQALTPGFDWQAYRSALGAAAQAQAHNVNEPRHLRAVAQWLRSAPLADVKTYLRWHWASSQAPLLTRQWRQAHFEFFDKALNGQPKPKPRWKQCVQLVDVQLGEALGREYVARTFSPELKEKVLTMSRQIEVAMAERIKTRAWMDEATKARALEKLHAVVNKVGYPERWRDYGAYRVARGDFAGNVQRGVAFEMARDLAKIGQPLDRGEWGMTPQTVNAYYNPQMNDINFPAAVLQPPLYDGRLDDAPNYGNTGGTIGHELTHAFDDEGRQFDAQGRLKNWWQRRQELAFRQRAQCVSQQYSGYTVVDDIKINSRLTLGEDLADLGGLILAWVAWQAQVQGQALPNIDGLTPEQRFFVGFAQWDCSHARPEAARMKARTDPHSPSRYRINGVVVNMKEFETAFACKPGQAMVKPDAERCSIW